VTPQQFIAAIAPSAVAFMRAHKISAALIIAQGALESGWGKTALAMGNNIFGIKADESWRGPATMQLTKEYVNGQWITISAAFRAYPSIQACLEDHDGFLLQPRYLNLIGADYKTSCQLIGGTDHYATDPNYAAVLLSIIQQYNLAQYDQQAREVDNLQQTKVKVNGKEFAAVVEGNDTYVLWTDLESLSGFKKENISGEWQFTVTDPATQPTNANIPLAVAKMQDAIKLLQS